MASNIAELTEGAGYDDKLIVKKVMPLEEFSSHGIYPFTFYIGGLPKRMFIDNKTIQGY